MFLQVSFFGPGTSKAVSPGCTTHADAGLGLANLVPFDCIPRLRLVELSRGPVVWESVREERIEIRNGRNKLSIETNSPMRLP